MNWCIHALIDVTFPYGVYPGASGNDNRKIIARDGSGKLVLRGTAIAGVVRQRWRRSFKTKDDDQSMLKLFGGQDPQNKALLYRSALEFEDAILHSQPARVRTHNFIDRHTKVVIDKALHEIEHAPAGATTTFSIWLSAPARETAEEVAGRIAGLVHGATFGGAANRGIGISRGGASRCRSFDLTSVNDYAAMLDARAGNYTGYTPNIPTHAVDDELVIDAILTIPRGQDLLVGGGEPIGPSSVRHAVCQQFVFDAAGNPSHVLIPGSAVRQPFRQWCKRLAAREGKSVSDSTSRRRSGVAKADDLAWSFIDPTRRSASEHPEKAVKCPVDQFFGTLAQRGRILIPDLLAPVDVNCNIQDRMHVAIDPTTGVSRESALFSNNVVVSLPDSLVRLPLQICIRDPLDHEVDWIVRCLAALHQGLIRIGNGKAAGRLQVVDGSMHARGLSRDKFLERIALTHPQWRMPQ